MKFFAVNLKMLSVIITGLIGITPAMRGMLMSVSRTGPMLRAVSGVGKFGASEPLIGIRALQLLSSKEKNNVRFPQAVREFDNKSKFPFWSKVMACLAGGTGVNSIYQGAQEEQEPLSPQLGTPWSSLLQILVPWTQAKNFNISSFQRDLAKREEHTKKFYKSVVDAQGFVIALNSMAMASKIRLQNVEKWVSKRMPATNTWDLRRQDAGCNVFIQKLIVPDGAEVAFWGDLHG